MRNHWIQRGSSLCQHKDDGFKEACIQLEKEAQRRYCTLTLFTRVYA